MGKGSTRRGRHFILRPDLTRGGRGHGVVFENEDALRTPPRLILQPEGGGFPPLKETPRLVYDPKKGDHPEDLEGGMSGYWLVSERLKAVFEAVDPGAFEFADCDYRLPDGSAGPRYFLCDVVRTLDALDESASKLMIEISDEFIDGKFYNMMGGSSLVFRPDVVGSSHVFKLPYAGRLVFCDHVLRDAVYEAGIGGPRKSRGLWFTDTSDI